MTLDDTSENPWPRNSWQHRARVSGDAQAAAFDVVGPQPERPDLVTSVDRSTPDDVLHHKIRPGWGEGFGRVPVIVDPEGTRAIAYGIVGDYLQHHPNLPLPDTGNPKDAIGDTKPPLHLVPAALGIYTSQAMANGAAKYGPFNWRTNPVRAEVYIAACLRHLASWYDGENTASDSGVHHLAHAAACLAILLDAMATENLIDDRPTPGPAARLIADFTKTTEPGARSMDAQEAERQGYTIDRHCYPWVAYKGPRCAPDEAFVVSPGTEEEY